jgi:hypothetical protein
MYIHKIVSSICILFIKLDVEIPFRGATVAITRRVPSNYCKFCFI